MIRCATILLGLVLAAGPALAGPTVVEQVNGASIDWSRGMIVVGAGAAADLRAPTATMARIGAERRAREAATQKLKLAAASLLLADGTEFGKSLNLDDGTNAAVEAITLGVDYSTDGSVTLKLGWPLEALRELRAGPMVPSTMPAEEGALIVDARSVMKSPAIDVAVTAAATVYRGPTIFYRTAAAAKTDPRCGAKPELTVASERREDGALVVGDAEMLRRAVNRSALVIVILGGK